MRVVVFNLYLDGYVNYGIHLRSEKKYTYKGYRKGKRYIQSLNSKIYVQIMGSVTVERISDRVLEDTMLCRKELVKMDVEGLSPPLPPH